MEGHRVRSGLPVCVRIRVITHPGTVRWTPDRSGHQRSISDHGDRVRRGIGILHHREGSPRNREEGRR